MPKKLVQKILEKISTSLKGKGASCGRPFCPKGIFALGGLPCGVCVVVKSLDLAHDKAEQLRRMGIREGCRISLISRNDPVLIVVNESRIALSRRLVKHIKVEALS